MGIYDMITPNSTLIFIVLLFSIFLNFGFQFRFEGNFGKYFEFNFRTEKFSNKVYSNREIVEDAAQVISDSKITYPHEAGSREKKIAIVDGRGHNAPHTYMKHIKEMFEHMGYQVLNGQNLSVDQKWDVMWYHDYAFSHEPYSTLAKNGNKYQIVNHVPGSGYYTSKVALATCGLKDGVPQAFQVPSQKDALLEYSEKNPDILWVQKDNAHRNIQIKKVEDMDLTKNNSFVQKFVDKPLLIDNRKFDIGIYTVVTSLLPLKVYIYDGDVLIRFCPEDYYPFDVNNVDKYVVGDDYTPTWEIESLSHYFNDQKMSFKHTLDSYLGMKNMDSTKIWRQISRIISEVFRTQQTKMLFAFQNTNLKTKYFELSRFDFVVDEELSVYLMEANMSPNLSSGHFKENQILYEKVLMSIFSLTGIANQLTEEATKEFRTRQSDQNPIVNDRDINLPLKYCVEGKCRNCDEALECQLCGHCMTSETRKYLEQTYFEHLNKRQMRRLEFDYENHKPATKEDHLLVLWLKTKCELDNSWCS